MTAITLSERLFDTNTNIIKKVIMVVAGVMALAISAKVQIPFGIIPGTFQLLVVMIIGSAYGARMGGITLLSYLAAGFAGAPVFALGAAAGPAYFMGPSAGYLIGFLVAAIAVGSMAERGMDRNYLSMFLAMLIGLLIIHAFGTAWLANVLGAPKALEIFTGFVLFDLAKLVVAIIAFPTIWKAIGEQR